MFFNSWDGGGTVRTDITGSERFFPKIWLWSLHISPAYTESSIVLGMFRVCSSEPDSSHSIPTAKVTL